MKHIDFLQTVIDLTAKNVVDVGAGDGSFARSVAAAGAQTIGIEIDQTKVERAISGGTDEVRFYQGWAEALPLADQSQDLICYIFSFHHIPAAVQESALQEARRVLRPGGRIHAVDPRPYGNMTEVIQPIEDETAVRSASQALLDSLDTQGWQRIAHTEYSIERCFADLDYLIANVIAIDPARAARLPEAKQELTRRFERNAVKTAAGFVLTQPCVAYHYQLA